MVYVSVCVWGGERDANKVKATFECVEKRTGKDPISPPPQVVTNEQSLASRY